MPLYEGIGLINEKFPVVFEIGHALTKAGFAGENSPRCILSTSRRRKGKGHENEVENLYDIEDDKDLYQALVEFLRTIYFRHLLVTPKDRKVVILESIFTTTRWRRILARVLYLHYEVLNILWIPNHLTAVVGTGADTALVLDIGKEEANVIPLVHGVTLLSHVLSHNLGANAFDKNLKNLLVAHAVNPKEGMSERLDSNVVEDIRVRSCFVAPIARAEKFNNLETLEQKLKPFQVEISGDEFQNFDGVVRELASEVWFQNDDLDGISIPMMILEAISKCPVETRRPLARSILVCGGTSMLPGFKGRLLRELKSLMKRNCFHNIFNDTYEFCIFDLPAEQNCLSWFGGSVYGSSEAMSLRGITKEYFLKTGDLPDWCSHNSHCHYTSLGLSNSTTVTPNASPIGKTIHPK